MLRERLPALPVGLLPRLIAGSTSRTQRKPRLPVDASGVFPLRAATRYRLQYDVVAEVRAAAHHAVRPGAGTGRVAVGLDA